MTERERQAFEAGAHLLFIRLFNQALTWRQEAVKRAVEEQSAAILAIPVAPVPTFWERLRWALFGPKVSLLPTKSGANPAIPVGDAYRVPEPPPLAVPFNDWVAMLEKASTEIAIPSELPTLSPPR